MILILMTSRSGSSLVSKIFVRHGFDPGPEPVYSCGYETFENAGVVRFVRENKPAIRLRTGQFCDFVPGVEKHIPENGVVKMGVEYATLFQFLDPMVITVKRDPQSIARSMATKRGHPEQAPSCLPGIHLRFRLMDRARERWNGAEINTDEIMAGDFSTVEAAFKHHGLEYDEQIARDCVKPEKWHKW